MAFIDNKIIIRPIFIMPFVILVIIVIFINDNFVIIFVCFFIPIQSIACVVVVVVYLKRLRIVLRCAKAGCGRRTSSS